MRVLSKEVNKTTKEVYCSLFADNRAEATDEAIAALFPVGYTISEASSIITADFNFAFMKSNGEWNWKQ